jgi:hypothetical protein
MTPTSPSRRDLLKGAAAITAVTQSASATPRAAGPKLRRLRHRARESTPC